MRRPRALAEAGDGGGVLVGQAADSLPGAGCVAQAAPLYQQLLSGAAAAGGDDAVRHGARGREERRALLRLLVARAPAAQLCGRVPLQPGERALVLGADGR